MLCETSSRTRRNYLPRRACWGRTSRRRAPWTRWEGMELAFLDATQDARVRENIHAAAYGSSPLGAPLLCPPSQLHTLSPKTLADFRALITQPQSLVVAGAGVGHDELIALAEKHFEPHLPPQMTRPPIVQSPYVGGCVLAEERAPTPSGYAVEATPQVRIACAMRAPEGGWHSKDLIACCVCRLCWGDCSPPVDGERHVLSFIQEVLNRYHWVEACEAFVSIHDRGGIRYCGGVCSCQRTTSPRCSCPICCGWASSLLRDRN